MSKLIFILRAVTNEDLPFLKEVYRSTREQELSQINWAKEQTDRFTEFQFSAQHSYYLHKFPGMEMKLIRVNSEKVGRLYTWQTSDEIRIVDISLLPGFQNRGIGTAIIQQLITESEQKEKKLSLHVEHQNRALRLYERFDFKKEGEEGTYIYMERLPQKKTRN